MDGQYSLFDGMSEIISQHARYVFEGFNELMTSGWLWPVDTLNVQCAWIKYKLFANKLR